MKIASYRKNAGETTEPKLAEVRPWHHYYYSSTHNNTKILIGRLPHESVPRKSSSEKKSERALHQQNSSTRTEVSNKQIHLMSTS